MMPPASGPDATAGTDRRAPDRDRPARSGPRYSAPISASAVANSAAPPTPWSARATSSEAMFHASPQSSEATLKRTTPITKTQPAPVAVGQRAAGQDQRRKRDRVRVDDPLQPGQAGVELALDARQRDVDDRDVDQQHERRRADGDQRPRPAPALTLSSSGTLSGVSRQDSEST